MKDKKSLIRIVNTENGVIIDKTGKAQGRGVYLCPSKQCVEKALKNKSFAKVNGFSLESVAEELENLVEQ